MIFCSRLGDKVVVGFDKSNVVYLLNCEEYREVGRGKCVGLSDKCVCVRGEVVENIDGCMIEKVDSNVFVWFSNGRIELDVDSFELLKGERRIVLGCNGNFGGYSVYGDKIFVSLDDFIYIYIEDGSGNLKVYDVTYGLLPRLFWSEELKIGVLWYLSGDQIIRFTSDFLDFSSKEVRVSDILDRRMSFMLRGLWDGGVTLRSYSMVMEELLKRGADIV